METTVGGAKHSKEPVEVLSAGEVIQPARKEGAFRQTEAVEDGVAYAARAEDHAEYTRKTCRGRDHARDFAP